MKSHLSLLGIFFCLIFDLQAQVLLGQVPTEQNTSRIINQSNSLSVPCNVTNVGVLTTSMDSVCPADSFILDIVFTSGYGTGMSFQIESSLDGINFSNVTGANYYPYTIKNQNTTKYYRMMVDCPTSGIMFTTPIIVYNKERVDCYCTPLHPPCDSNYISNVEFGNINNSTLCANTNADAYTLFIDTGISTGQFLRGLTYNLSVTTASGNATVQVWIDYNQNAIFEFQELYVVSLNSPPNISASVPITIPTNISTGITRLRVRCNAVDTAFNMISPCDYFISGETEDYDITINSFGATTLSENNHESSIVLYPNPSNGKLCFKNISILPQKVSIYDMLGNLCFKDDWKPELDISDLTQGSYFVKLDFESNELPLFKRIIVAY